MVAAATRPTYRVTIGPNQQEALDRAGRLETWQSWLKRLDHDAFLSRSVKRIVQYSSCRSRATVTFPESRLLEVVLANSLPSSGQVIWQGDSVEIFFDFRSPECPVQVVGLKGERNLAVLHAMYTACVKKWRY